MHRFHPCVFTIALFAVAVSVARAIATDVAVPFERGSRDADRPRLTLTFVDFAQQPASMLAATQSEAAAIVVRMGVDVRVRTVPPGATLEPDQLTLIFLKGSPPAQLTPGVMGAVKRDSTSRALWVFPASVAAGMRLAWSERSRWSTRERERFAIALARVAVHEVVHLVCPWREHDPEGLMAGVLGHRTLTGSRLPLDRDLLRDFRLGVGAMDGAAVSAVRNASARSH